MKNIAIIPARSGSKGLKDKNIRMLCGKPLIAYSIECAAKSQLFDKIFVSTDSLQYAQIAEKYGGDASFLRTEKNSGDEANSWDVVKEVIANFEDKNDIYDNIMLLQPTSPLRSSEDIKESFALMRKKSANAIISVTKAEHSPAWCDLLMKDLCMDSFCDNEYANLPRQMIPDYYRINGAIYLLKKEELYEKKMFRNKCYAYIMPNDRSIDIDTELDFTIAESILNTGKYIGRK